MIKKCTSARTADQKSFKCLLLFRHAVPLAILMLSTVFCKGQSDTLSSYLKKFESNLIASEKDSAGYRYVPHVETIKDSTWYVPRIDTIKTDFVIIVDVNDFVKKVRCDFLVHKYEQKQYSGYRLWVNSFFPNRNDTFFVNNKPVEVLLYRPKGEQMLVGNIR